jgi:hypothetical protein
MRAHSIALLLCFTAGCDQFIDDIAFFPDGGPDLAVADMSRDSATGKPDLTVAATPDLAASPDLASGLNCSMNCPPCAVDQLCIGAIKDATYETTCAPRCSTQNDCGANEHCVAIYGEQGATCVRTGWPRLCPGPADAGGDIICPAIAPTCLDVSTLLQTYVDTAVCGVEHLHCDHGCVAAANNMPAQCSP